MIYYCIYCNYNYDCIRDDYMYQSDNYLRNIVAAKVVKDAKVVKGAKGAKGAKFAKVVMGIDVIVNMNMLVQNYSSYMKICILNLFQVIHVVFSNLLSQILNVVFFLSN